MRAPRTRVLRRAAASALAGPEGPERSGFAYADPLQRSHGEAILDEPGRYLHVCFIPNADGVPHYKLDPGMLGFVDVE